MYRKYLCTDFNCAVFVYGTSTQGVCPGCGEPGVLTTDKQGEAMVTWYNITRGKLHI